MKVNQLFWILSGILCAAGLAQVTDPPLQTLHLHLPRTITLPDSDVRLANICVLRGSEAAVAQAGQIRLGQLFNPSQDLTVSRAQILSRLACCGLKDVDVKVTGATQVVISRDTLCIKGEEMTALARQYAQHLLPKQTLCQLEPMRTTSDLTLGQTQAQAKLVPSLVGRISSTQIRIRVTVEADGVTQTHQDITFRIKHQRRVLVATATINSGEALTRENTRVETRPSALPQTSWQPPYGQITNQIIPLNTEIHDTWSEPLVAPVTLKRNEAVVIQIKHPGLLITAMGQVLADANGGQVVKVKNLDSNRILLCRVEADGSVSPLL